MDADQAVTISISSEAARQGFRALLDGALVGKCYVITRYGKPVAVLSPAPPSVSDNGGGVP